MIPAVGYLRRSTLKQELSIDGQRAEIIKYADRNDYVILRWYVDNGISGSTGDERPEFQRLIADAKSRGDFRAVLTYDIARFGRMDADETGYYRYQLKQAGVQIIFTNESAGNADDETSEIIRPVLQAQKRQFLRQVSRDTLRGQIQAAKAGWASGRAAAFGYDRMLVDASGISQKRLKRGERYVKDRSWHVTLVPSNTPGEAAALQWMFQVYHQQEIGIREIARLMNERGLRSPHGGAWTVGTVREIFRNPVYKGWLCFGRRAMGKFHRARQGEVQQAHLGEGECVDRPQEEWIIHKKLEIALVPEALWDAVNVKLAGRGERARGARARRRSYPLGGLIRCSDCGAVMVGTRQGNRQRYYCSSFYKSKACTCNAVHQDNLLTVLKEVIAERLFCGGNWAALKEAVLQKVKQRPECQSVDTDTLKRQLEAARVQHQRAAQNLLLASPENVPVLNAAMSEIWMRVQSLETQLANIKKMVEPSRLTDDIIATAKALFEELMTSPNDRLKAVLSRLVQKIELRYGDGNWGRRRVRVITGCDLYLYSDFSFTTGGRGDWI